MSFRIIRADYSRCSPHVMSFAEDPLVGSIAKQYIEDRELHDRTAKEYTQRYATG